ncbi:flippase [Thioalkalivibrio sulfidiphilus]|uniref:flippase n=1 Tax=Thioalkalivibrio sulfidiphilus TaxID=1033854 RepID=UPI003BB0E92C
MSSVNKLTSGRLLARSAIWNLAGMAAPVLVALVAIPLLIEGMGKERFGLLAIIWMGVGYFSLFDLGLGRALTKLVSERLGRNEQSELGPLIWTAFILLALLGLIGASVLIVLSPLLVTGLLQVPEVLHDEAIAAFRILAVGVPIVIITAGLVGILEAHQRFRVIAQIRIPLGVLTFAGPLLTLQFSPSIAWATTVLLISRLLAMLAYYWTASHVREELRKPRQIDRSQVKPLLSFGGWLTVTNIVGPLMTYMDRFFIGAKLGLSAVTYYVTPYEILARMQMLPQAIMGVMFPAMATAHGGDAQRLNVLYTNGSKVLYWAVLPVLAGTFLLGPEALSIWLGEEFRNASTPVVHWLAAGWMINVLAQPAFAVLQAAGRPDLTAKTHLAEFVPYLGVLWWLAGAYGIAGVAAAWMLRVVADTLILNVLVAWKLPILRRQAARTLFVVLTTLAMFAVLWLLELLLFRLAALLVLAVMAAWILWPIVHKVLQGRLADRSFNT